MINITITKQEYNKIKFKKPHDILRLLRHNFSNYDTVINDDNWKYITTKFVNEVCIHFPILIPAVKQWANYKLTNYMR